MAWDKDNSPWGQGGKGQGPRDPWNKKRPNVPNFDDLYRKGQDRFKNTFGSGGNKKRIAILGALIIVGLWFASGFYVVNPEEQGIVLRFGKYVRTTSEGLHYHLPSPIETVLLPKVEAENLIQIGFRSGDTRAKSYRDNGRPDNLANESLMLTGDGNIVDINFTVQWRIKEAEKFLFNVRNPEKNAKLYAESAMREVIGQMPIMSILAEGRGTVEQKTKDLLQKMLDDLGSGIMITKLQLSRADPPQEVIDAFREVERANQDKEKMQNEAQAYRNSIIPEAKGKAAQILQEALAYQQEVANKAFGDGQRFLEIYKGYQLAQDIYMQRFYLETMEEILKKGQKVIIDQKAGSGQAVVPYLPLPELKQRSPKPTTQPKDGDSTATPSGTPTN